MISFLIGDFKLFTDLFGIKAPLFTWIGAVSILVIVLFYFLKMQWLCTREAKSYVKWLIA
jgi:hypothetical protein